MSSNGPDRWSGEGTDETDPALAATLRRAMRAEADTVVPAGDGLARIREGIEQRRRRAWWQLPGLAVATAAVVALVAGGVALGLRDEDHSSTSLPATSQHTTSDSPTPSATTSAPEPTPTPTPTHSSNPRPTATAGNSVQGGGGPVVATPTDVWVYYVMNNKMPDDSTAARLYRERHTVTTSQDGVPTALAEMFSAAPADPDYRSYWPAGTEVLHYSTSGDLATVDLSAFPKVDADQEQASVQQLVYTVTANDLAVHRVQLLVNGSIEHSANLDWTVPVRRAPMLDIRGLVWITAPSQGATVGSPVTVKVNGTGFEGNVILKVFKAGRQVDAVAVTTAMGQFADAQHEFKLPPGTYTVRAYNDDAQTGALLERDSKTFTVG
jgi:spore germination protein GerM